MSGKPDPRAEEIKASGAALGGFALGLYLLAIAFFTWYDNAWPGFAVLPLDILHLLLTDISPTFANNFCAGLSVLLGFPMAFFTAKYLASPPTSKPLKRGGQHKH